MGLHIFLEKASDSEGSSCSLWCTSPTSGVLFFKQLPDVIVIVRFPHMSIRLP